VKETGATNNMKRPLDGVRAALGASLLCALVKLASAAPVDSVDATPYIVTRDELYLHLATNPDSPIHALSQGARERFLISLRFNENGLTTLDPGDIVEELTDEQIHTLLSYFGRPTYAPKSHAQEIRAAEPRVSKRSAIGALERRYNDFYLARSSIDAVDTATRTRQLAEVFDAKLGTLYSSDSLRRVDDRELRLLRRAARDAALGTNLPRHVGAFESAFAEGVRRKLVSTDDVQRLRDLYLTLHRFKEARELASTHPAADLPPLPQFQDRIGNATGRATVWKLDEGGERMTRTAVDLAPLQIVVAAACHLSQDAARDISKDELLGPVFAQHAKWLVPPPGRESVNAARDWNRELPRTPVAMIYDRQEWSMLPHWNMPTFFIMRDGQVIDFTSGWATGGAETRDQLITVLQRNGLLPTP
jgi:hypothetical protein